MHENIAVNSVFLLLLSFNLASRLQAHSNLMIQPGGAFSGERNAYKCKQSHLRAAENVAQFSFNVGH